MKEDFSLQTVIMMPVGLLVLGVILLFAMSPAQGDAGAGQGPVAQTQGGGTAQPSGGGGGRATTPPGSGGGGKLTARFETPKGSFEAVLYPEKAPNTVTNFVHLATSGFYDGLTFHRVIPEMLIQGGSPTGDDSGGPDYWIETEIAEDLRHDQPGVLSMASAEGYSGSQFFITLAPTPELDDYHGVFGKVTKGMDVVQRIGKAETDEYDAPVEEMRINRIVIMRDGQALRRGQPEPQKVE